MDETIINYRFPFTPFPTGWFRIDWSHALKPAGVKPLRYLGRDLVLFRTKSGRACVLDAHCPHLGAHLGYGGKVINEEIQCPFHGWQLDTNGSCTTIPQTDRKPPAACVRSWPVREANGVIMLYYDPDASSPEWDIPLLEESGSHEWTQFRPGASWRIRTHVQELGENGMDKAHFPFLHPQQTISMRSEGIEIDKHVLVHRTFQNYRVFGLAKFLVDEVCGPLDLTLYGLGMAVNRTCVDAKIKLYYTFVFFFTPVDEETTEVTCMLSMKKTRSRFISHLLLNKAIAEGEHTIDQDVPIWENKIYRARPLLSETDGPIMKYRNWARQFYPQGNATRVEHDEQ